ncbi:MAG: glycosyltransferase [Deltaproteobacteria bacterium]|nr:glycosyltransferase [Deltaproteobacteria bacterium]
MLKADLLSKHFLLAKRQLNQLGSKKITTLNGLSWPETSPDKETPERHEAICKTLISSGCLNLGYYGNRLVPTTPGMALDDETYQMWVMKARDYYIKYMEEPFQKYINSLLRQYISENTNLENVVWSPIEARLVAPLKEIQKQIDMVTVSESISKSKSPCSFSVITSFYNHYEYLRECATSIKGLIDFSPNYSVEWILVNDDNRYSHDTLNGVISETLRPAVTILSDGENLQNLSTRLNQGIRASTNEWLLFLDCDDLITPNATTVLASYVNRFPRCRYISSCMVDVDERGAIRRYRLRNHRPALLFSEGMIAGHLKAIRKDVFHDYGLFDENWSGIQDYCMAIRIATKEPILFIPEYLYYYRWHTKTQSFGMRHKQNLIAQKFLRTYFDNFVDMTYRTDLGAIEKTNTKPLSKPDRDRAALPFDFLIPTEFSNKRGIVIIRTQGNRLNLLLEAVKSIEIQSPRMMAMIVVHGDNEALSQVYDTIRHTNCEHKILHAPDLSKNRGYPINVALNALYESDKEFGMLSFLDDDDIYYPIFSKTMSQAITISEADVICFASNRCSGNSIIEKGYSPLPAACLLIENFIPINGYCIRYSKVRESKILFNENLAYLEDWDFLIRLLKKKFIFFSIGDTLAEFRITGDGNSPCKKYPRLWEDAEKIVRLEIASMLKNIPKSFFEIQLSGFNFGSRGPFEGHDIQLLESTRTFIDEMYDKHDSMHGNLS